MVNTNAKEGIYMSYVTPLPVIRKKHIIKKLSECNAFSRESARTLEDAGVYNPYEFEKITELLCQRRILIQTGDKYYLGIHKSVVPGLLK